VDQILAERSAVPALTGRHVHKIAVPVFGELSKAQEKKVAQLAKRKLKETPKPKNKKAKKSYDMWNEEGESHLNYAFLETSILIGSSFYYRHSLK
jgi:hypothetical protein